jgi:hypothetical protein
MFAPIVELKEEALLKDEADVLSKMQWIALADVITVEQDPSLEGS